MGAKLAAGDQFPAMTLSVEGGGTVTLPDDLEDGLTIVLFYRGHW